MAAMTISQLARGAGVGVETVRYYQRRGLLPDPRPQKTGATGIRHYGPDELRRLRFIRQAQTAGFTLEEIAELLRLDSGNDRARAREMARARGRSPLLSRRSSSAISSSVKPAVWAERMKRRRRTSSSP